MLMKLTTGFSDLLNRKTQFLFEFQLFHMKLFKKAENILIVKFFITKINFVAESVLPTVQLPLQFRKDQYLFCFISMTFEF